ncbi:hypothetical protein JG687_00014181 [Phytophthora cactorum]|uniref:Uncharacterized protein n=2 Tax=Phytophthora cactorum TaxID=29920 RepID=A0A8T1TX79_9STRA|nr:hypothetical protein PC112_g8891 [Phytophthora cactorum]KAG3063570.1 hypothetical protein PC122_g18839 [Phytophthora cactorum]KAG6950547.1 hypothetical protein JG687_00014181 [Phytophthora cactorum]
MGNQAPEVENIMADAHQPEEPAAADVEVVEVSRSKVKTTRSERTPLLSKPEEEVYPLPWFRSPEWTRHPPPPARNPGRRRQDAGSSNRSSVCPSALLCCYNSSASDAGSESELELGYLVRRPANAREADEEADSFKQCIQFLVGLILIMAMALILLIIFQPKPDSSR